MNRNIKNILSQLSLLILCSSSLFASSALVKISDSKRSICGFLVSDGGKKYLYTSQTALFGMHLTGVGYKFNARAFTGNLVNVIGPLMVSAYSDVARVEVSTDATELLKMDKIKDFGEKVKIFPRAITNKSDKSEVATIVGIGVDAFTLKAKLTPPFAGTPVLNSEGNVVGVLSNVGIKINRKGWSFNCTTFNFNIGGRLDSNIKWVPAGKIDFIEAGNVINDSKTLLKAYMPILNWWLKTPYSTVPGNISYPKEVKRFVLYNNERTPFIRKLVNEIQRNPIAKKGQLNKVRDGCLHRAKLFTAFPIAQVRQLNLPWKTPFLRNEGVHYSWEWSKIIKAVQAKKRGLEFRIPF